jgi:tetratricopeptide (TPR) repeat protein
MKRYVFDLFLISMLTGTITSSQAADHHGDKWEKDRKDGLAATQSGAYPRAEKLLKQSLRDAKNFKETDPRLTQTLDDLAEVYIRQKKFDDATPLYMRVLKIEETKHGKTSVELIKPLNNIVRVTCAGGECYDTIPYLKRLLSIRQKAYGPNSRDVPVTLLLIGEAYEKRNKYDEAIAYFRQAIAAEKSKSGNSPMSLTLTRNIDRVCKEKSIASSQATTASHP